MILNAMTPSPKRVWCQAQEFRIAARDETRCLRAKTGCVCGSRQQIRIIHDPFVAALSADDLPEPLRGFASRDRLVCKLRGVIKRPRLSAQTNHMGCEGGRDGFEILRSLAVQEFDAFTDLHSVSN